MCPNFSLVVYILYIYYSTGSPQGCVPSPLLYNPVHIHPPNQRHRQVCWWWRWDSIRRADRGLVPLVYKITWIWMSVTPWTPLTTCLTRYPLADASGRSGPTLPGSQTASSPASFRPSKNYDKILILLLTISDNNTTKSTYSKKIN